MIVVVIVESSFLFIQAGKAFRSKSTSDLELSAFLILLVASILWVIYGWWLLKDATLIFSSSMFVIGSILVIVAIFLYSD